MAGTRNNIEAGNTKGILIHIQSIIPIRFTLLTTARAILDNVVCGNIYYGHHSLLNSRIMLLQQFKSYPSCCFFIKASIPSLVFLRNQRRLPASLVDGADRPIMFFKDLSATFFLTSGRLRMENIFSDS